LAIIIEGCLSLPLKMNNNNVIRIGTRKSPLAVWQAELVQNALKLQGFKTQLVLINSEGDKDLVTPLYEMGVEGIFTKTADTALLNHKIDIAVHSFKDVPIKMANGIVQAAVLKRDSPLDILVYKNDPFFLENPLSHAVIATGSIRRIAQWLHRFPHHKIENLRGTVNTRLQKLLENTWNGAIFAAAGLERLNLRPKNSINLDWMLPAPAQGAIVAVCRENDLKILEACWPFNDPMTALCTQIERDFLKHLLGGCATPIAALATVEGEKIVFKGNVCSKNGAEKIDIDLIEPLISSERLGINAAKEILSKGANKLILSLQK
jgi:hydroxymethylbilane synthase